MGLPIGAIIRTLGKLFPNGATKASAKIGGMAAVVATISAAIPPVNELAAAIQGVALALSALAGAIAGVLGVFGVGRKAGSSTEYLHVKTKRS